MTAIVVTVARDNWPAFLAEHGPGTSRGRQHVFHLFGDRPPISPGDTLYVVSHGRLRCALMLELIVPHHGGWQLVASLLRAVTLPGFVQGFPDWRRCWWRDIDELPFPSWRTEAVNIAGDQVPDHAHGKTRSEHAGSSA